MTDPVQRIEIISPKVLKECLDLYVSGQDAVKDVLATVGYNIWLKAENDYVTSANLLTPLPSFIPLIVGKTGTGKTTLVQALATILGLPFTKIDASLIDAPHRDNFDIFKIIEDSGPDYSIIFIDEFDKLFSFNFQEGHNGGYYTSLVSSLLPLLDSSGTNSKISTRHKTIDLSKKLIILGGAFEYVYSRKESESNPIGYGAKLKNKKKPNLNITKEDLSKYTTMTPEIIGRIDTVVATNTLTKKDYYNILYTCMDAVMPPMESLYLMSGRTLAISKPVIDKIIKTCQKSKFGARMLKSLVFEYVQKDLMKSGEYRKIIKPALPVVYEEITTIVYQSSEPT